MHQKADRGDCTCTYNHQSINLVNNYLKLSRPNDRYEVCIEEKNAMLYVLFKRSYCVFSCYNLTYAELVYPEVSDKRIYLLESFRVGMYLSLLYHYEKEVDEHILKFKNPSLFKSKKKIKN
jgi:hypothetical protein